MTHISEADAAAPRILNCLPSPTQETDWTFGAAVMAGLADTALPQAVDHRETWWTVGDQGATGACVGWATADGLLRYHFVKAGWIAKEDALSTRFTWMASKEVDDFTAAPTTFIEPEGTSLKAALDVSRKYGAVLDDDLPFAGGRLFAGTAQVFYTKAARLKIASYTNLGPSLLAWRRWLAGNGPILVRLDVDATWDNAPADPLLAVYRPDTARGGHAVALVGYTPEGFIVRNSWGDTWGDHGFVFATDTYAAAAFTEAYGVALGGAAPVSAGIVGAARKARKAEPVTTWPVATWPGSIEDLLLDTVQEMQGRRLEPTSAVGQAFPDIAGFIPFLRVVEGRLDAPGRLSSAPPAKLEHLRQGFFDELADWVGRQVGRGVEPEPVAAEILAAMTPVTIARDPAATAVLIDGVKLPQGVSALGLPGGAHTLRVGIRGKAGDAGTGKVLHNGQPLASQTARIPEGLTEAFSAEETFNV